MKQTLLIRIRFPPVIKKKSEIHYFDGLSKPFCGWLCIKSHFDIKIDFFHLSEKVHAFRVCARVVTRQMPGCSQQKEPDLGVQGGALWNNHDQPRQLQQESGADCLHDIISGYQKRNSSLQRIYNTSFISP